MRRALAGLLGLAACAAAAALAWRALRPARPPQLVAVTVVLQGSTASNEAAVAVPLESALATTKGLTQLRTEVRANVVTALCFFEPGADGLDAAETVREAIDQRRLTLPAAASVPLVTRAAPDSAPLWAIGGDRLRRDLETLNGVASVEPCGEAEDRLRVQIDPLRLAATGIELGAVLLAVRQSALGAPSVVRALPDPAALGQTVVGSTVPPTRLADLATITAERASTGCEARGVAEREILAKITLQQGANRRDVARALESKVRAGGGRWLDPARTLVVAVGVAAGTRSEALAKLAADLGGAKGVSGVVTTSHESRDDVVELVVGLEPAATKDILTELRQRASGRPGVVWRGVRASPFGLPSILTVTLRGPDRGELEARARAARAKLAHMPKIGSDLEAELPALPVLEVTLDRQAAARAGASSADVAETVRAIMGGIAIGAVVVRIGEPNEAKADVLSIPGVLVHRQPLASFLKLTTELQPASLLRIDRQPALELHWETESGLSEEAVERALAGLDARIELQTR